MVRLLVQWSDWIWWAPTHLVYILLFIFSRQNSPRQDPRKGIKCTLLCERCHIIYTGMLVLPFGCLISYFVRLDVSAYVTLFVVVLKFCSDVGEDVDMCIHRLVGFDLHALTLLLTNHSCKPQITTPQARGESIYLPCISQS